MSEWGTIQLINDKKKLERRLMVGKEFPVVEILSLVYKKFPNESLPVIDSFLNQLRKIWEAR